MKVVQHHIMKKGLKIPPTPCYLEPSRLVPVLAVAAPVVPRGLANKEVTTPRWRPNSINTACYIKQHNT